MVKKIKCSLKEWSYKYFNDVVIKGTNARKITSWFFNIGNITAMCLSWERNHSVFWLFINTFFGWFYVLYYCVVNFLF
ncbi:hypothetical protein BGI23_02015 [Bacillus sp. ABP14]|nr:hypothetical protein YBT020_02240 [Bacillus thuringiensis serovar finitimus YBT-020]AOY13990.1 hypothetical protein BGI23_02015 [Bacillus sp. ABP14]MBG9906410.1 hypothetical protein [Bacillus paranthracis]OTX74408.1 hypothetical protein BK722_07050 [Bacillus thuringiensis serovar finitimus]